MAILSTDPRSGGLSRTLRPRPATTRVASNGSTAARGADGLFAEPGSDTSEREKIEDGRRESAAQHFFYADQLVGPPESFDAQGDYNCGRCNQARGTGCLLVAVKIDLAAGSCGDWEQADPDDQELPLHYKTAETSGYAVAANGEGFGCHRCPYARQAKAPDSKGRDLWCGKLACRVFGNACCVLNGARQK